MTRRTRPRPCNRRSYGAAHGPCTRPDVHLRCRLSVGPTAGRWQAESHTIVAPILADILAELS